jgi:restriction system protein
MAIPDFQTLMRPVLTRVQDGNLHRFSDIVPLVAQDLALSAEDLERLLPSGSQAMFRNRLHWASFYLLKAGLLERPKRAWLKITERGLEAVRSRDVINSKYLQRFDEFREFQVAGSQADDNGIGETPQVSDTRTPEELLEQGYARHRGSLATDVLAKVKACSPEFFERLVIDLLVAMGYGGSRKDAGRAVGRSGDGGIDGIIKEDRLGLDAVYVQAKRWEASVGRPVVQAFAGSLEGQRARKGVLITTSAFSSEARYYVTQIEKRIVLIGGEELADLMIEHRIGVTDVETYTLKRLDSDYFDEES